ncbi:hypothetical protein SAMN04489724_2371 [Algoriphagus locisalis]|uniref:Uncharacterized protein n=1 Tax=Algoriphagus locisalis TaxID=305507 RepID=A0A1I7BF61_9BACT|nr:hypothetical protein SAMN04489724_2371 [Algoriphagus locisalis]
MASLRIIILVISFFFKSILKAHPVDNLLQNMNSNQMLKTKKPLELIFKRLLVNRKYEKAQLIPNSFQANFIQLTQELLEEY